ncbi:hypothetical protein ACFP65_09470 [Marinilactibacillus sp. GCM10026970]|uniref:hypothetical protein n=1 Tax=Marinilactibacillus sp. GCM10026970 TaxID=3252642 RepID=UPI0036093583
MYKNNLKSSKTWVITLLLSVMIFLILIITFNTFVDPNWSFNHSNRFNAVQVSSNFRKSKANYLKYKPDTYNTLLLGSSRIEFINQEHFNEKTFNYGVPSAAYQEFESIIDFVIEQQDGIELEKIIIGLDFFITREENGADIYNQSLLTEALTNVSDDSFRYKELLSIDTFFNSIENSYYSLNKYFGSDKNISYRNRNNVGFAKKYSVKETEDNMKKRIEFFRNTRYDESYIYNTNYKEELFILKNKYPNTEFVVFTNPITIELFETLKEENKEDEFKRWIRETVEVFGEVHNFIGNNSVTSDKENYQDSDHYYPHVGDYITYYLDGKLNEVPSDFGTEINKENIDEELSKLFH